MQFKIVKSVIGSEEVRAVSARELHFVLESKQDFSTWIKARIEKYDFVEGQDYLLHNFVEQHESGAKHKIEYYITLDMAKELSMVENNEQGKICRKYFIECEKQLRAEPKQLPQTYLEALEQLVVTEKEKQQALLQVDNLKTVVDDMTDWASVIRVAKHNKVSEKCFSWRKLKPKSKELGYELKYVPCARYDYKVLYHLNVFRAVYPQYDYNLNKEIIER